MVRLVLAGGEYKLSAASESPLTRYSRWGCIELESSDCITINWFLNLNVGRVGLMPMERGGGWQSGENWFNLIEHGTWVIKTTQTPIFYWSRLKCALKSGTEGSENQTFMQRWIFHINPQAPTPLIQSHILYIFTVKQENNDFFKEGGGRNRINNPCIYDDQLVLTC